MAADLGLTEQPLSSSLNSESAYATAKKYATLARALQAHREKVASLEATNIDLKRAVDGAASEKLKITAKYQELVRKEENKSMSDAWCFRGQLKKAINKREGMRRKIAELRAEKRDLEHALGKAVTENQRLRALASQDSRDGLRTDDLRAEMFTAIRNAEELSALLEKDAARMQADAVQDGTEALENNGEAELDESDTSVLQWPSWE